MKLPNEVPVFDLSNQKDVERAENAQFGIGRYNERRETMYQTPLFEGKRCIHMGIDFFAPAGTEVFAVERGKIVLFGYNGAAGDYGYTLITEHSFGGRSLYALYGHLNQESMPQKEQNIQKGQVIARVGDRHENGGWTPHLHFQISWDRPTAADMPGVVSDADHLSALQRYPDPRIVLGPVYL